MSVLFALFLVKYLWSAFFCCAGCYICLFTFPLTIFSLWLLHRFLNFWCRLLKLILFEYIPFMRLFWNVINLLFFYNSYVCKGSYQMYVFVNVFVFKYFCCDLELLAQIVTGFWMLKSSMK